MGEAKRRREQEKELKILLEKYEVINGDNCGLCGEPFVNAQITFVGITSDDKGYDVCEKCSVKLTRIFAAGIYICGNNIGKNELIKFADRMWFLQHPDRSYHIRKALPGELKNHNDKGRDGIVVKKFSDTVRRRVPFTVHGKMPFPEDNEQRAKVLYDIISAKYATSDPGTISREALEELVKDETLHGNPRAENPEE